MKIVTPNRFKFIGESLCLDFVNTVGAHTGSRILREKLGRFEDLILWSELAGILTARESKQLARNATARPEAAAIVLTRAIVLREALYRLFQSTRGGRSARPADLESLNSEIAIARSHQRLARSGRAFVRTWDETDALDRPLWNVTLSAAELLASPEMRRLRQCGGEECGWLFLDTSRNHSRQWCDMRECGNRAKVKRFRLLHHRNS